jgi:hypothetical protein
MLVKERTPAPCIQLFATLSNNANRQPAGLGHDRARRRLSGRASVQERQCLADLIRLVHAWCEVGANARPVCFFQA